MSTTTTNQDIFNTVWNHFIVGDGQPSIFRAKCLYRGPKGTKCAVGLLISDEKYSPEMENMSLSLLSGFLGLSEHDNLLHALQDAHDCAARTPYRTPELFKRYMRAGLKGIALDFNLETPK